MSVCCVLGGVGHRASVQGAAARGAAHRAGGKPRSAVTMKRSCWFDCLFANTQYNEQHYHLHTDRSMHRQEPPAL